MTNDYLFRALLQSDNHVLKALIASLLRLSVDDIYSADIQNPIELGKAIEAKEFYLDVKVLMNSSKMLNLEMQVINEKNWPERSVLYLCRTFDSLNRGENYADVRAAYQIGFTDFSPVEGHKEFYATYKLMNIKSHEVYTDKFAVSVVDLTCIDKATREDKQYGLDQWAMMFKAKTWEDLKMLEMKNPAIDEAVSHIHVLTEEEKVRLQIEAREEYYRIERTREVMLERAKAELREKDARIEAMKAEIERLGGNVSEL